MGGSALRAHFLDKDAEAILSIPISLSSHCDKVLWHYTSNVALMFVKVVEFLIKLSFFHGGHYKTPYLVVGLLPVDILEMIVAAPDAMALRKPLFMLYGAVVG
ncbi:unnamed protein product [Prunus armeniaca]|uniref:Uncharacterized protein n=1 Tax=Prunus armeniaca TaxID=36596 RepID=A0A6J5WNP2_PRUAR|nr:unnamed protein product [Prunus armeniaca]